MGNLIKTGFLLAVLTCLLVLIGGAIGGQQGMAIAFILAFVMNVGSYWFSDKIVLSMYGAQPVDEAQAPGLYRIVRELAAEAKIPVPPIYLIQDDSPNAFATGRNPSHAAVAVTEGAADASASSSRRSGSRSASRAASTGSPGASGSRSACSATMAPSLAARPAQWSESASQPAATGSG